MKVLSKPKTIILLVFDSMRSFKWHVTHAYLSGMFSTHCST